jgi:precorrin-2 methylase
MNKSATFASLNDRLPLKRRYKYVISTIAVPSETITIKLPKVADLSIGAIGSSAFDQTHHQIRSVPQLFDDMLSGQTVRVLFAGSFVVYSTINQLHDRVSPLSELQARLPPDTLVLHKMVQGTLKRCRRLAS